jgi:hypothetical protein
MSGIHTIGPCLLALACVVAPLTASAACYQLFDSKNRLVLQSTTAPVDTSKPYSDEVARLYPGHALIVADLSPCDVIDEVQGGAASRPFKPTPDMLIRDTVVIPSGYEDRLYTLPSRAGAGTGSYRSPPGTDVRVRAHTRKDGTYVPAHTRGRPGSKSK